jgi:hypothetical protein
MNHWSLPKMLLAGLALVPAIMVGQMVDPAIDRPDEPFCYFSQPTDVLGVMDGREGTLVTPEGYLYTGWGEYMFFTGNPPVAVNQRVRTLYKGYLPAIEYSFNRDGLAYHVRMFATTLDGNPESPLMNFVRVNVINHGKAHRTGYFGIATRYQNDANSSWGGVGDHRFGRPAKAKILGQFEQAGVSFSGDWEYAFGEGMFLRDGKVLYLFPENVPHVTMMTLKTGYNDPPDRQPGKKWILPTTPVGVVLYRLALKPDEHVELIFRIPYEPFSPESSLVSQLREASFDNSLGRLEAFWGKLFASGLEISIPEEKVVHTFKANLIYDLIARNKEEGSYIQKVNEFQYDAFWLRDASYIVRSYDLSGYHDIARECLEFFPRWQQPDGNFVSQGGQFDGWGQALWGFGQHYRITRDHDYAASVYPLMVKAVGWLRSVRESDSLHLVPVTTPGDNEEITGHVTGHNFWALVGLKQAIIMARDLGKTEDEAAFQSEFDSMRSALMKRLKEVTERTGGYITPGLDSPGGQDWDNMSALYPEILMDPHDPMVTGTLNATRAKYQEGLMTYGDGRWLHHYLTVANTEAEVIRGDQELAVRDLYALLVHTSATHAGFEFCIRPWGDRDFGMNLAPHGWFSARYRSILRDMLVREEEGQIHLLSCVSPEWIGNGKTIGLHRAPTNFGPVSFDLSVRGTRAVITVNSRFTADLKALVLHFPWFMKVHGVKINGKVVKASKGEFQMLPLDVRSVELQWTKRKGVPSLNYASAVQAYLNEYHRRYEDFRKTGTLPD